MLLLVAHEDSRGLLALRRMSSGIEVECIVQQTRSVLVAMYTFSAASIGTHQTATESVLDIRHGSGKVLQLAPGLLASLQFRLGPISVFFTIRTHLQLVQDVIEA